MLSIDLQLCEMLYKKKFVVRYVWTMLYTMSPSVFHHVD